MNWIVGAVLNFIWGKLLSGAARLYSWFKERKVRQEIVDENMSQAERVEKLAEEIKFLIKEGKPVPAELEQRLSDETRKLLSDNSTVHN